MALLKHNNSLVTLMLVGTPAGGTVNYILELHAQLPGESFTNPIINIPIPDDLNSSANSALSLNLRRITEKIKLSAYIYDTRGIDDAGTGTGTLNTLTDASKAWTVDRWIGSYLIDVNGAGYAITDSSATTLTVSGTPATGFYFITAVGDKDLRYDHCYIESSRNSIFNSTTGLITAPANPLTDSQNVKSAMRKRWMLQELARAGTYNNAGSKEALTLQIYQVYNPSGSMEAKNYYHKTMSITSLSINPVDGSGNFLDWSDTFYVDKFKVDMELIRGDPNA